MELALDIVMIVLSVALTLMVLFQSAKDKRLSGAIAGGADTFYGKDKASHADRTIFICTLVAAIVFALAVLAVYVIQPDYASSFSLDDWMSDYLNQYSHVFPEIAE